MNRETIEFAKIGIRSEINRLGELLCVLDAQLTEPPTGTPGVLDQYVEEPEPQLPSMASVNKMLDRLAGKPPTKKKGKRGPLSPEARASIAAAQKKRWAAFHKAQKKG